MKFRSILMMAAMGLMTVTSLSSCNDILGEWDRPVVNTIAEKTGYSPEQISAILKEAMSTEAVQEAIANQTPITVNISSGSTSGGDQTITIPMEVSVGGKKLTVVLNFTEPYETSAENPLVIKANEGSEAASAAESQNNLVVSMPASTGLVVNIVLPQTTVTLKTDGSGQVIYKSVTAKTAQQTLIIGSGVTIDELNSIDGFTQVMDGGKLETYLYPAGSNTGGTILWNNPGEIRICDKGVIPVSLNTANGEGGARTVYDLAVFTEDNAHLAETPYYTKKLKITKGDGSYAKIGYNYNFYTNGVSSILDKLTIADGAKVKADGLFIKTIEGGSNAEILLSNSATTTPSRYNEQNYYLCGYPVYAENISNINFSAPECTNEGDLTEGTILKYINLYIPCPTEENTSVTYTFEGCKFSEGLRFREDPQGIPTTLNTYCYWKYENGDYVYTTTTNIEDVTGLGLTQWTGSAAEFGQKDNGIPVSKDYYDVVTEYNHQVIPYHEDIKIIFKKCSYGFSMLSPSHEFFSLLGSGHSFGDHSWGDNVNIIFNFGGNENYKWVLEAGEWRLALIQ